VTWIIVVLVAVAVLFIVRKQKGDKVTLAEVEQAIKHGGQLVDVRTSGEFSSGHAKGAKNVPLQSLQVNATVGGDKSKPVYVYCHSGARAGVAKTLLTKAGYGDVRNIGGLHVWKNMGGTVV
jgi:phage shock protein E